MSTITDAFGRSITVAINQAGEDIYSLVGFTVSFPTGTPQAQAIATIDAMAPDTAPLPPTDLTFLQFMALFSATEQMAIVNSTDPQIRLFCLMAAGNKSIQLTNPEVVAGINYLVTTGILTSANAAMILSGSPSL